MQVKRGIMRRYNVSKDMIATWFKNRFNKDQMRKAGHFPSGIHADRSTAGPTANPATWGQPAIEMTSSAGMHPMQPTVVVQSPLPSAAVTPPPPNLSDRVITSGNYPGLPCTHSTTPRPRAVHVPMPPSPPPFTPPPTTFLSSPAPQTPPVVGDFSNNVFLTADAPSVEEYDDVCAAVMQLEDGGAAAMQLGNDYAAANNFFTAVLDPEVEVDMSYGDSDDDIFDAEIMDIVRQQLDDICAAEVQMSDDFFPGALGPEMEAGMSYWGSDDNLTDAEITDVVRHWRQWGSPVV